MILLLFFKVVFLQTVNKIHVAYLQKFFIIIQIFLKFYYHRFLSSIFVNYTKNPYYVFAEFF